MNKIGKQSGRAELKADKVDMRTGTARPRPSNFLRVTLSNTPPLLVPPLPSERVSNERAALVVRQELLRPAVETARAAERAMEVSITRDGGCVVSSSVNTIVSWKDCRERKKKETNSTRATRTVRTANGVPLVLCSRVCVCACGICVFLFFCLCKLARPKAVSTTTLQVLPC